MGIGRKATDQRTPVDNFWLRTSGFMDYVMFGRSG